MLIEETQAQGKQLPEEIIEDIFKRLPVQSLVRFSCTCKLWRNLIFSDSKFNKAHIDHAKRPSWKIPEIRFGIEFERTIDCDCNLATLRKETLTSYLRRPIRLLGSCNGLLFIVGYRISDGSKQHLLWNPYTNSIKIIDKQIEGGINYVMSGLSYDRASDDYKAIVVMSWFHSRKHSTYVFSLRRNSWKKLPNLTGIFWDYDQCGITLDNGICHWQVASKCRQGWSIIWFDPVVEKFKDVPLPDKLPKSAGWFFRIGALDGCLSLVHINRVWVMKEYGFWTKLHVLRLTEINKPIGYNSSKDKVLVACGEGLFRFTIADVDINKCGSRNPSEDRVISINDAYNVVTYTESLLCPWTCLFVGDSSDNLKTVCRS